AETLLASRLTLRAAPGAADPDPSHVRLLTSLLHGSGTTLHQFGGDETLGQGLVWTRLAGIDQNPEGGTSCCAGSTTTWPPPRPDSSPRPPATTRRNYARAFVICRSNCTAAVWLPPTRSSPPVRTQRPRSA